MQYFLLIFVLSILLQARRSRIAVLGSAVPSFLYVSVSALLCPCDLLVTWDMRHNGDHIVHLRNFLSSVSF